MTALAIEMPFDIVSAAKTYAAPNRRTVPAQIAHWAKLGKAVEDNPDLPVEFTKDILAALEEEGDETLKKSRVAKQNAALASLCGTWVGEFPPIERTFGREVDL